MQKTRAKDAKDSCNAVSLTTAGPSKALSIPRIPRGAGRPVARSRDRPIVPLPSMLDNQPTKLLAPSKIPARAPPQMQTSAGWCVFISWPNLKAHQTHGFPGAASIHHSANTELNQTGTGSKVAYRPAKGTPKAPNNPSTCIINQILQQQPGSAQQRHLDRLLDGVEKHRWWMVRAGAHQAPFSGGSWWWPIAVALHGLWVFTRRSRTGCGPGA